MSIFPSPKVPAVVPPPNPATMADPGATMAGAAARGMATSGLPSTLLTSAWGVNNRSKTSQKDLTGQ